ncbi:hypothetical protein UA45_09590 [Morganella morganii]|uniref:Uncharacterized protein n=1 Tax=Morganella morganii TaxID=582 RepID=A0A0D8L9W5_MORMO|nr:hypothetical protein UA45_09590 [Morganella morganii]
MLYFLQTIPPNAAFTQHNAQYIRASPANCASGRNKKVKNGFNIRFFRQGGGGYVRYNTLQPALPGFGGYLTSERLPAILPPDMRWRA